MPKAKAKSHKKQAHAKPKRAVQQQAVKIAEPKQTEQATPKRKRLALFGSREKVSAEEKAAIVAARKPLTPAPQLFLASCRLLWQNRKLLGGILIVYAIIDLILIGGADAGSLQSVKSSATQGGTSHFSTGLTLFAFLINSNTGPSDAAAGAFQSVFLLILSVVFIWALRQVYVGHKTSVREAFYTGTYPIIPFILVLMFLGVQLLPVAGGGFVYNLLVGGKILIGFFEQTMAVAVFLVLAFWSLYMITATLIALYVVTLPNVSPVEAITSARQLVRFRRLLILRKMLFLVAVLAAVGTLVIIPTALFLTPIASWLFFLLSVTAIGVVHTYFYTLYRELL